jgi:hypothetical protein
MTTRQLLYVCAPWRTRTPEEEAATTAAIRWALKWGWCPVWAPSLLAPFLEDEDPDQRAVALRCAVALLAACDGVLVVGERRTDGMRYELEAWFKRRRRKPELSAPLAWPQVAAGANAVRRPA